MCVGGVCVGLCVYVCREGAYMCVGLRVYVCREGAYMCVGACVCVLPGYKIYEINPF